MRHASRAEPGFTVRSRCRSGHASNPKTRLPGSDRPAAVRRPLHRSGAERADEGVAAVRTEWDGTMQHHRVDTARCSNGPDGRIRLAALLLPTTVPASSRHPIHHLSLYGGATGRCWWARTILAMRCWIGSLRCWRWTMRYAAAELNEPGGVRCAAWVGCSRSA